MKVVLGMGFGDEGKGLTTSFLCSQEKNPIVVRFNGGQQAGHTVVHDGKRHIFSNFGSGSLQGVPTVWSHYCTFCPASVLSEYRDLNSPELYVHGLCPVTTPYDVLANKNRETTLKHGSIGVGFGATIQRQEDHFKLHVQDLRFEMVVREKLHQISNYYGFKLDIEPFLAYVREALPLIEVISNYNILQSYSPVFEGAQGILLDMDYGFFPNVTRSNTVSKNALSINPISEVYYITRTYQTRHGNGFMTNENIKPELVNNELESNVYNEWQGHFRTGILDIDLLRYSLTSDKNFHGSNKRNLVITCVDQTGEEFNATLNGKIIKTDIKMLPVLLGGGFERVLISKSDISANMGLLP